MARKIPKTSNKFHAKNILFPSDPLSGPVGPLPLFLEDFVGDQLNHFIFGTVGGIPSFVGGLNSPQIE